MIGSAVRAEAGPAVRTHHDAVPCTQPRPNVHPRPFAPRWAPRPEEVPS
jgi:hypothetical protein